MLFAMLAVVFTSIFIAFNLFINSYILSNVHLQLDELVKDYGTHDEKGKEKPQGGSRVPNLSGQKKNKIGASGEVLMLNGAYELLGYNASSAGADEEELKQIASCLKDQGVSLSNAQYVFVDTGRGEYYISSIAYMGQSDAYLVFYVGVAGLNNLVNTGNLTMLVIVVAAMLICFFIARLIAGSVTKPVKEISSFAEEIGKGNFQRQEFSFQDKEFEELGEAMNQAAEKLDLYDRDQRTFFQNVSHELRTPLQSIRCYAEGVACGLMEPEKSGATIIAETDRLSALVEDLLYISRVDNLSAHVEMQENDLRETLALCAENLKTVASKNGLHIVYQFDDDPVLFTYNEKHMYRAFSNLIANAVRYARATITLRCVQASGHIEVSVMDDGPGISPGDLPHVFERFYKGKDGKHGIGLSIVKSVVELHGGEITVYCDDAGTRFTIRFPAK